MPSFQSPLPNERQAVRAGGECRGRSRAGSARRACRPPLTRVGWPVGLVLVRREQRRLEERHALVEHAGVAGRAHVLGDDVRQPEQVVGAAGAEPAAARLVPPVLHVAFDELPAGGAQQMCSRARSGRAKRQRHHVLQLIAEAERAARLVVAGARPQPAAHVLIEQPAVHQHVERIVRRAHLDRARAVPSQTPAPRASAAVGSVDVSVPRDQLRARGRDRRPGRAGTRAAGVSPGCQDDAAPAAPRTGSRPGAELRPDSVVCRSAAGRESVAVAAEERPRDRRSPTRGGSLACANATRPANSWL